jgi:RluA family pseudouridine synthase
MKRFHTRVPGAIQKSRLDHFLGEWFPRACGEPISRSQVRTLIQSGSVYVNRHREKNPMAPLFTGAVVEVYYDKDRLDPMRPKTVSEFSFRADRVIFEDAAIIVVNKPPGIPTQPTLDPNRANLFDLVKRFLSERDGISDPYLGLHHRLDLDTSGLVLFTKREEANKGVADLFKDHRIQKSYHCLCWPAPEFVGRRKEEKFTIDDFQGVVNEVRGKKRYGSVKSGGSRAITEFRVMEIFPQMIWMEARPKTGRTHQIRVHCSENGFPILGDPDYFPIGITPMIRVPRLMLHAAKLEFNHPMNSQPMNLTAMLPDEFLSILGQFRK